MTVKKSIKGGFSTTTMLTIARSEEFCNIIVNTAYAVTFCLIKNQRPAFKKNKKKTILISVWLFLVYEDYGERFDESFFTSTGSMSHSSPALFFFFKVEISSRP